MVFVTLGLAAVLWFSLHAAVAGSPLRSWLIARLGEGPYRGLFSVASLASLWFLVHAYQGAPYWPLWDTPRILYWLPLLIVPFALVLFVGAFTVPNPTTVGGEKALAAEEPARGVLRITRHPFLWAVTAWAFTHLVVNPDVASVLLFGSLLATAFRGTYDIDGKRRRSNAAEYRRYEEKTSNVPFVAIARGRNRLVLRELLLPLAIGLVIAGAMLHFHTRLFGASALAALR